MGHQREHQAQNHSKKADPQLGTSTSPFNRLEPTLDAVQEILGTRAASRQLRAEQQQSEEGNTQIQPLHQRLQSIAPVHLRAPATPLFQGISQEWGAATSRVVIQPKLTIGQPNDQYEQEADRAAKQIVQQLHTPLFSGTAQDTQIQRTQHSSLPDLIQRCGDEAAQGVPRERMEQIMQIFQKNGIQVKCEDIFIVKDDPSGQICHEYALQGLGISVLRKFTLALKADLIDYERRNDYQVVIAAYSSDGSGIEHSARWESGKNNDQFVHKLAQFPYFACDPLIYQTATQTPHLWFFGFPKTIRDEQPSAIKSGKTRKWPPRHQPGRTLNTEQQTEPLGTEVVTEPMFSPPLSTASSTQAPGNASSKVHDAPTSVPVAGRQASVISKAALRANDPTKTRLTHLDRGDTVTITATQKAGSRFALNRPLSQAQDHYWVMTATGQEGWIRKDAIQLN